MKIKTNKIADKYEIIITCQKCKQIVYKNSNISPENLATRKKVAKKQKYCFSCNSENQHCFTGIRGKRSIREALFAIEGF